MERVYFEMEFLENVVLNKSNNTEGFSNTLDFVSGSVFLGIVAREYERFSESFEIFHTPKVRFSQAVPYVEGKRALRVPFSFYHSKGDASKVFNAHLNPEKMQYGQVKEKEKGILCYKMNCCVFLNLGMNITKKVLMIAKNAKVKILRCLDIILWSVIVNGCFMWRLMEA